MKTLALVSLLLALALPVNATIFDGTELTAAYGYSLTSGESLGIAKLSVDVGSFNLIAHDWPVAGELLVIGDSFDDLSVGLGASIGITDSKGGFSIGGGYIFDRDIGWTITIGVLNIAL